MAAAASQIELAGGNEALLDDQVCFSLVTTPQSASQLQPMPQTRPNSHFCFFYHHRHTHPQTRPLVAALLEEGQDHLFSSWPPLHEKDDEKRRLLDQLCHLDSSYAGGLIQYVQNARRLLKESQEGVNPFEGCEPTVPEGESLDFGSAQFREFERKGVEQAGESAFVLVAGGLGERLGYSGIKLALPCESASGICFLQLYIEAILAMQAKAQTRFPGRQLPLMIMTSDDTHARTEALLSTHNYFGATKDQIKLLKQEKVACLSDTAAHLAVASGDPFSVQTKPHGHGDVHMLLHSSGTAQEWAEQGFKWVCFFQDTNAQVFRALPAALGVSVTRDFDVNSLAVPRKAKEAIGAIARLEFSDSKEMTINVEYNQLDPLLRATINPEGDVNDPKTGYSPFPGNINQLVLKLSTYVAELERHGGVIGEFVNPKYADASRTAFKSSTRLECMMQDFPKSLPEGSKVGFTVINQVWAAYSPVKNSPADAASKAAAGNPSHSATSGEFDIYETNCRMLRMLGVSVDEPATTVTYNNISGLHLWPRVTWSPLFAATFDDLAERFPSPKGVHIGADTTLIIRAAKGVIKGLDLKKGALMIEVVPPPSSSSVAIVVPAELVVENEGYEWVPLDPDMGATEEEYIRGFRVVKHDVKVLQIVEEDGQDVDERSNNKRKFEGVA